VATNGEHIYAIFEDFRGLQEETESGPHLYFTRSTNNGETWSKNIRVNDVKDGVVNDAHLTGDERGLLYCLWQSGQANIFGQIYSSHSADDGQSWSRAVRVDEGDDLLLRRSLGQLMFSGDKLFSYWDERRPGWQKPRFAWLEPLTEPPPTETPAPAIESRSPPAFNEGERLFADDFSSGNDARWQVATGVWTVVDGALMGVEPGLAPGVWKTSSMFARVKEPERYILRGRFKLDPLHHQMAYLYVRANPAAQRYYVIGNGFQTGVGLSLKEDDAPPLMFGPFVLIGRPLAQRRFPFQKNRWYAFTLAVTPERVDYYIDGRWMLSYEGKFQLPPGRMGIGGFSSAPTYFDDIAVYKTR
jgi:hypothetical protein